MRRELEKNSIDPLVLTRGLQVSGGPEKSSEDFDLPRVPASPGCYVMRDEKGQVLYVGKANVLRARLRAYLNERDSRQTVQFLMRRVTQLDFFVTATEKEALLLENSLIKQHRPRYNFRLKDDKTYVSLRLNLEHPFPRLTVTRKRSGSRSRYFGPYSSANAVRETLRQIQRVFPLRTCSDSVLNNRARPCLYYQMGQCAAPCVGLIEQRAYQQLVKQVIMVLEGRNAELEKLLQDQIRTHAEALEFEKAAEVRDRLYALRKTLERQRTVQAGEEMDRDVLGLYAQGRYSEIQVLFFRNGAMTGGRSFSFNQRETPLEELLSSFLVQYYDTMPAVPAEILIPLPIEDASSLAELLGEKRGGPVRVYCPQRGEKRALVELAERNARSSFEEKRLTEMAERDLLEQIRDLFSLSKIPERIECFDISTIQGDKAVGSLVSFRGGHPDKSGYRRFAIKQVAGQDDFAMMREVLLRRLKRAIAEGDLTDLVVLDGGKGQLNVARAVFRDLGIEDLDAVAIAKSRPMEGGKHSPERFFTPGRKNPIILPQNSPVVHFLARVRDEAHRFAVAYHRKRRTRATLRTPLLDVPGIGPRRARALLRTLGSVTRIREASTETIAAVPGFNDTLARIVKEHLEVRGSFEGGSES